MVNGVAGALSGRNRTRNGHGPNGEEFNSMNIDGSSHRRVSVTKQDRFVDFKKLLLKSSKEQRCQGGPQIDLINSLMRRQKSKLIDSHNFLSN